MPPREPNYPTEDWWQECMLRQASSSYLQLNVCQVKGTQASSSPSLPSSIAHQNCQGIFPNPHVGLPYIPWWMRHRIQTSVFWTPFPGGSVDKEFTCNPGDLGLIPGSGRSPGEGNGNALQYSCLENPMGRGVWWAIVMGLWESDTI